MARKRLAVPLGTSILFLVHPAIAEEYPDNFALNAGVNAVYSTSTQVSVNSSGGVIGTSIDFERDLNGEEKITPGWLEGYYRFTPSHRIDFGWVRFTREGSKAIEREITFRDTTFAVGTSVDSEIEATFAKLGYTWSFHHSDDVELGLGLGAVISDYSFKLEGPLNQAEVSGGAPAPTIGFRLDYKISPRTHLKLKTDAVYFDPGGGFEGSLDNTTLAVEWRAVRNVVLGLGFDRLSVDASYDDGDLQGQVSDFYRSTRVYAGVRF